MPRFLVTFNDGDMTFPQEELAEVGAAAHAVMHEAMDAGVWIVGGGFDRFEPVVVGTDGNVTQGPLAYSPIHLGGFTVLDVASRDEALRWAARIAAACRCAQEVRQIMADPEQEQRQAAH